LVEPIQVKPCALCTESISVIWTSDELGALTHIEGGYYGACL